MNIIIYDHLINTMGDNLPILIKLMDGIHTRTSGATAVLGILSERYAMLYPVTVKLNMVNNSQTWRNNQGIIIITVIIIVSIIITIIFSNIKQMS